MDVPIVDRTRLERDVNHVFDRHVLVATPSETKLSGTTFIPKDNHFLLRHTAKPIATR